MGTPTQKAGPQGVRPPTPPQGLSLPRPRREPSAEHVQGGDTRRGANPVGMATRKPAGASSRLLSAGRKMYFLIKVGQTTLVLRQRLVTGKRPPGGAAEALLTTGPAPPSPCLFYDKTPRPTAGPSREGQAARAPRSHVPSPAALLLAAGLQIPGEGLEGKGRGLPLVRGQVVPAVHAEISGGRAVAGVSSRGEGPPSPCPPGSWSASEARGALGGEGGTVSSRPASRALQINSLN